MSEAVVSLLPEWERIDLLGACLSSARRGMDITEEVGKRLGELQQQVLRLRQESPWRPIVDAFGLEPIDQDILACAVAPVDEPRIGWMYQELQPGVGSSYPTPALIREMFAFDSQDSTLFNQRLQSGFPLQRSGMLEIDPGNHFQPILPTSLARSGLLGWQESHVPELPGTIHVPAIFSWDDLVLPDPAIRSLNEFVLWVKQRSQVEEWGAKLFGGPVALFCGPSGTGKTCAAEAIANELKRELFRVDLGMLVSKYVGETEKNLNRLFDAARNKPVLLLFDEADALFGKRGEIKEARDRYANMEVSHLLTRIESHVGPCILTSNLREQIDQAFLRRFQIVVNFSRPDAAARAKIWRNHIPSRAPLDDSIDFSLLGSEFGMTGGQIRNAALHAAFLAAGESKPISSSHIASAVWTEFSKRGGELSISSLGAFASHLPKGERP